MSFICVAPDSIPVGPSGESIVRLLKLPSTVIEGSETNALYLFAPHLDYLLEAKALAPINGNLDDQEKLIEDNISILVKENSQLPIRSWFVGNSVLRDGTVYTFSRYNPLFIFLNLFEITNPTNFQPLDAILENSKYPDLEALHQMKDLESILLPTICDTQKLSSMTLFRLSSTKVELWLESKITALSKNIINRISCNCKLCSANNTPSIHNGPPDQMNVSDRLMATKAYSLNLATGTNAISNVGNICNHLAADILYSILPDKWADWVGDKYFLDTEEKQLDSENLVYFEESKRVKLDDDNKKLKPKITKKPKQTATKKRGLGTETDGRIYSYFKPVA